MDPEIYLAHIRDNVATDELTRSRLTSAIEQYSFRLWHEFSISLLQTLIENSAVRAEALAIHERVLARVRAEISPDVYIKMVYLAVHSAPADMDMGVLLEVLDGASASLSGAGAPQHVRAAQCLRALLLMRHGPDLSARRTLSDVKIYMDSLPAQETSVSLQAVYYRALLHLNELLNDHDAFYHHVFQYVVYAKAAGIPIFDDEVAVLAYKTSVAGLLAKDVYNFGQLVNFPAFQGISTPDTQWVTDLTKVCHAGDVSAFEAFVSSHRAQVASVGDLSLAVNSGRLGRKVRLMSLLNFVYFTPPNARTFPLDTLATKCVVGADDIEPLVLSAFALGLIQGKIDGLAGTVECTWVQPRVLSLDEIRSLAKNIGTWRKSVKETSETFSDLTKDIPK